MTTITLNIQGMTCGGCVNGVKRVLTNFSGVRQVEVSLEKGRATIEYDPAQVLPEQLKAAIGDAGYDVKT